MQTYHNSGNSASGGNHFTFSNKKSTCPKCGMDNFHVITHVSGVVNSSGGGKCFTVSCNEFVKPISDLRSASNPFTQRFNNTPQGNVALKPQPEKPKPNHYAFIEKYIYTDENDVPLFEVHRKEGRNKDGSVFKDEKGFTVKTFSQLKAGTFESIGKETRRVLYRLQKVLKAIQQGETVYIVEGEKDVHTLERFNLVATCNAGGAGKWNPDYSETLRNAEIVILPDNDEAGKLHAEKVVNSLFGIARSLKVVSLRNLPPKGDVTDFFNNGGTLEQLLKEIQETPEISRPIVNVPELTPEQEFIEGFTLENAGGIPEHIYPKLPPFLKELCDSFTESHEKDVFLSASLPVGAAHMPNVITRNADRFHTLDFYMAIVARAGSGKGKAEFAFRLASVTDSHILKESQDAFKKWKEENALNERNAKNRKQDSKTATEQKPMPIERGLSIPANTPATPFIRKVNANGGRGLIKESEIDVINGTLKQDWGAMLDSFLRQAFHHENYSLSRTQTKDSEEAELRVENPQISVVLTGTENQIPRLLGKGGIENGLYSRFAFYCFEAPDVWQSRRPSVKFDKRELLFKNASEKLFKLWQYLSKRTPLEIKLTDEQFDLIDSTFAALRSDWRPRNNDIAVITQRSALIAQRIIGILTVLRNIDSQPFTSDSLIPTDTDAQTGVELAVLYFEHAARFAVNRLNSRITNNTDKKQRALELHAQGLSLREIATETALSHMTVKRWIDSSQTVTDCNTVTHVTMLQRYSGNEVSEIPVPEMQKPELRSNPKPPEQLPESLELISTDELNAGFFGERTTAKFNLIKAICEARNISGREAGTLIQNSIAYGLLHDSGNDKYERLDL